MLNSEALTKIQSIFLIVIIAIAAVSTAIFVLLNEETEGSLTIKIGICYSFAFGEPIWQATTIAAEEINSKGGILGKKIELIREDTQEGPFGGDSAKVSLALTRLITNNKIDFVLGAMSHEADLVSQGIIAEHEIVYFGLYSFNDVLTERVLEDYDKYKYFFAVGPNSTALSKSWIDAIVTLREYTGFNKVGYLADDSGWTQAYRKVVEEILPNDYGFESVYHNLVQGSTIDFASFLAQAEAVDTEILVTMLAFEEQGIAFINEWYVRQSPMVLWGIAGGNRCWEVTGGNCEHITSGLSAVMAGFPLSNWTLPFRESFIEKTGDIPNPFATAAYDVIRFILPDAIERAGTIETEAVIESLEEIDIATAKSPRFVFTPSHSVMFGPGYDDQLFFQWQTNGIQVPVYPKEIMEEAGASYTFPDWPGPWDDLD